MTKIKIVQNPCTSYIYHMLSVSKCGYDNTYGEEYKVFHKESDLELIKEYESYLSVSGGEYSGKLYGMCVAIPASLMSINKLELYFEGLIDLFSQNNPKSNYVKYKDIYSIAFDAYKVIVTNESHAEYYNRFRDLSHEIVLICHVMLNNLKVYFNLNKNQITLNSINDIQNEIDEIDILHKWESLLGIKYPMEEIYIMIIESIEQGPNAIDIAHNKDVIFYDTNKKDMINLISHEVGIIILKHLLEGTNFFHDSSYYLLLENFIESYNNRIVESVNRTFTRDEYITFFNNKIKENSSSSVLNLLLEAKTQFEL